MDGLKTLLSIIGEEKRDEVIAGETRIILDSERLSDSNATFLIAVGRMDEAETYILNRAHELDGGSYVTLS